MPQPEFNNQPSHRERMLEALMIDRQYPPTMRELGEELGLSTGNTRYHLEHLFRLGYVTWQPRIARTLQITEAGREATRGLRAMERAGNP